MRCNQSAVVTASLGLPLKQSIRAVANMGAEGLVFDVRQELRAAELSRTGERQLQTMWGELSLKVAAVSFPVRRTFYDAAELDARVAGLKRALEFANRLGAKQVLTRLGRVPEETDSEEYRTLCEVANDLARHGDHVGARLAVVPSADSPEGLGRFLCEVRDGQIGMHFDPAAFVMAGYEPVDAFRRLHETVVSVQARDGLRDVDGGGRETALGRGEVDWVEMLAVLDEAGFRDWFVVDRTVGSDRRGDIERAVQFLKTVGMGA